MKKDKYKISIIIPVYNSEKYIERCIKSILEQSYKNYEIIVINDGSKDNSLEIINKYQKQYPEIIKVIDQKNMGCAKTRNKGMKIAKGDYIAFIDNDDYIDNDYLSKLIDNSDNGKNDMVLCGYKRINSNDEIIEKISISDSEWGKYIVLAPWAKIYKRSFLIDNNILFLDNNIGEDIYFNLQAILLTKKIKILSDYLGYNWFLNTESVSNTIQKDFSKLNVFKLLNSCVNVLKEKSLFEDNYQYLELFFFRYVIWFLTFTTKKHSFKNISKKYDELFEWLKLNFPNYKKNKLISFTKPEGASMNSKLLNICSMILHKMRLAKLALFIFSKR